MNKSFKQAVTLLAGVSVGLVLLVAVWGFPGRATAANRSPAPQQVIITVDLQPVKDNTLYESATGSLSNGAGQHLFVGQTAEGLARRALLAFDVAGNIPASATILSATLTLNMSRSVAGDSSVALHTVQKDWGEGTSDAAAEEGAGAAATSGDATWLHTFFNTATWTQAGGDFAPAAVATTVVGPIGTYTWDSPAMVTEVQNWLATPATNFGWILVGDETAVSTAKRFDSHENSTASSRPTLTVTYSAELNQLFLPVSLAPY